MMTHIISKMRISLIVSTIMLICVYMSSEWRVSLGGEKIPLMFFERIRHSLSTKEDIFIEKDSVLLVDTYYDKKMVLEYDTVTNLPIGMTPATDHNKLFSFLSYLKKTNQYKYILLDIFLENSIRQNIDSSLYKLISSMPRIVVACPPSNNNDSMISKKIGKAEYTSSLFESDFVKYPFITKGTRSIPLIMYEEITGNKIKQWGPFLWDRGLVKHSTILTYEYIETENTSNRIERLGLLVGDTINGTAFEAMIKDNTVLTQNKYILIGDFKEDRHNTYLGEMSGTIINYNAYISLLRGHHRVSIIQLLFIFLVFFILCFFTMSNSMLSRIVLYLGVPFYLTVFSLLCYYWFEELYDILIATTLFFIFKTTFEIYHNRQYFVFYIRKFKLSKK